MKFVRYRVKDTTGLGVLSRDESMIIPLDSKLIEKKAEFTSLISHIGECDLRDLEKLMDDPPKNSFKLQEAVLLAPIQHPAHDILCVGVNYSDHLEECVGTMDIKTSMDTIYFSKRTSEIIGPDEDIPGHFLLDTDIDYEVELAVVIGKSGRDIALKDAEDYIFGYSIFNDISARGLQKRHSQWFRGKSLDGFAIMGPVVVHKSAMPMPFDLKLTCRVNGEIRQSSNTRFLIQSIPGIISELSQGCTLVAGDIIATGTPGGVGMSFQPPRYLKPGDLVTCEIEKIGEISNRIVY